MRGRRGGAPAGRNISPERARAERSLNRLSLVQAHPDTATVNRAPVNQAPYRLIDDVSFGEGVVVYSFTNLYGCRIGSDTRIGTFVEVQRGAEIGALCKVQSHTFVCEGVRIGDRVFIGHGVTFINDKNPRATSGDGSLQTDDDWELVETVVDDDASIGSGVTILCGVRIGAGAQVGAGAVVTKDVAPGATVVGNPAAPIGRRAGA
jgi:UDP-2-acetamido-3-amino-2,3-dideoxy-glucuronate N-acetyltransferase